MFGYQQSVSFRKNEHCFIDPEKQSQQSGLRIDKSSFDTCCVYCTVDFAGFCFLNSLNTRIRSRVLSFGSEFENSKDEKNISRNSLVANSNFFYSGCNFAKKGPTTQCFNVDL